MSAEFDTKKATEYFEKLQKEIERRKQEGAKDAEWLPGERALLYVAGYMPDQEKESFLEELRSLDNKNLTSKIYHWSARHLLSIAPNSVYGEFDVAEIIRQEDYKSDGRWDAYKQVSMLRAMPG